MTVSCNKSENKKKDKDADKVLVQEIKKVEVDIDGMTCEIGCAKLIESKLSKTDGIQFVSVSFEEKKGQITFDANKIGPDQIAEVIEATGGGDLYKVTDSKEVEQF